jgi:hypothetical protein
VFSVTSLKGIVIKGHFWLCQVALLPRLNRLNDRAALQCQQDHHRQNLHARTLHDQLH